ncbi:alcohol dehydrogenase [Enterococcus sp. JM4C]|uniref:iron-containing alcohol dehydrogenase family protein n=1 Tax=Candidatus Enterococcus huntleyi TaxID=1857217 RepID=UPI00137AC638|nr:iron-containing alcohol dehydrogenase family protein [Enterococcus sp. JM4C]KAF1295642.1 alcohol dehydrogenase [Enterococcus sp. JM4C]
MEMDTEVRPGANRYLAGETILNELPNYLKRYTTVAVVTGEISFAKFKAYYPHDFDYPTFVYDGSASEEDAQRLADIIGQADVVIGIGGGRVLDTAKMTAENLRSEFILIPTLISNCAPFSPVAAVYNPDHSFKEIGYYTYSASLLFVDWTFLLQTPKEYFIAGIGDTLAKWYEIEGITRNLSDNEQTAFIRLGIASAKEILSILLTDSEQALKDLETQTVSPAFGRVADTIIALAGTVGGFAAKFGRSAGAHAVHNGLSYIPSTHEVLHGAKVAYGILVQLAHTNDFDEITSLLPFYETIGLPTRLEELNVREEELPLLEQAADFAAGKKESFQMIDDNISAEQVLKAIRAVEELERVAV